VAAAAAGSDVPHRVLRCVAPEIGDEGTAKNKAVHLALGIRADGRKKVLGLWIEQTEGAKFWLKVFNELKNRGLVLDCLAWGFRTMINGIGVFYPDKRPTQRVGIVPDIEVKPTIAGLRAQRDEVLEAATEEIRR
jgi:hypothetical protein